MTYVEMNSQIGAALQILFFFHRLTGRVTFSLVHLNALISWQKQLAACKYCRLLRCDRFAQLLLSLKKNTFSV